MRPRHLVLSPIVGLVAFGWAIVAPVAITDAQAPKRGGTLRVSYGNEISHLDFYTAPGYELNWVAMNIGCGLLSRDFGLRAAGVGFRSRRLIFRVCPGFLSRGSSRVGAVWLD